MLGVVDADRATSRSFSFEYLLFDPTASVSNTPVFEIGITPLGDDHGGSVLRLDPVALAEVVGLPAGRLPHITTDERHPAAIEWDATPELPGLPVEVHIPHFSTFWVSVSWQSQVHITDIWGTSSNDMWAVGWDLIARYDGNSWSTQGPASPGSLAAVTGDGDGRMFVAGAKVYTRSTGGTWTERVEPWGPGISIADAQFMLGRYWVVGTDHSVGGCPTSCKAFAGIYNPYTNAAQRISLPTPDRISLQSLSVTLTPAFNAYAVGVDYNYNPARAAVYMGPGESSWALETGHTESARYGVHGLDWNDAYTVGYDATVHHFDGNAWTQENTIPRAADVLLAVREVTPELVWAGGCFCNTILQKVGTVWHEYTFNTGSRQITDFFDFGKHDLWLSGQGGIVMRYTNGAPLRFQPLAPASGAVVQPASVTLRVNPTVEPDLDGMRYDFYVSQSQSEVDSFAPSALACSGAGSTCTVNNLVTDRTYYWKARACDDFTPAACTAANTWNFITNSPPVPCLSATTNRLVVDVDASCTSDPDGDPITYTWYWNDGSPSDTGVVQNHAYKSLCPEGDFTVTLQVQDMYWPPASIGSTGQVQDTRDSDGDLLVECREAIQWTSDLSRDTDQDGITDLYESVWLDDVMGSPGLYNRIYCDDAAGGTCAPPTPNQFDLYVEVDWLQNAAPFAQADANSVINAFNQNGIHIHIDHGQLGGAGEMAPQPETVDFMMYKRTRDPAFPRAGLSDDRDGIWHHATVACRDANEDPQRLPAGRANAPGDRLVLYACRGGNNPRTFMHEVGHNILGYYVDNWGACNGPRWQDAHNPLLAHFQDPAANHAFDCDGDGDAHDAFAHSTDPQDVMSYDPNRPLDYAPDTWQAIRLDVALRDVFVNRGSCEPTQPTNVGGLQLPNVLRDLGLTDGPDGSCST